MAQPALVDTITEFNPVAENITAYLERLQLYMTANRIADNKNVPMFLTIITAKAYILLLSLLHVANSLLQVSMHTSGEVQVTLQPPALVSQGPPLSQGKGGPRETTLPIVIFECFQF